MVITLTPREATAIRDELLDPGEFPWQSTESQLIALELKNQLKGVIETMARENVAMLSSMVPRQQQKSEEQ